MIWFLLCLYALLAKVEQGIETSYYALRQGGDESSFVRFRTTVVSLLTHTMILVWNVILFR